VQVAAATPAVTSSGKTSVESVGNGSSCCCSVAVCTVELVLKQFIEYGYIKLVDNAKST
jgi:hypothetical protein